TVCHVVHTALVLTVYLGGCLLKYVCFFFFSSRRRHTRCYRDWSSDVCSSDLPASPSQVVRAVGFDQPFFDGAPIILHVEMYGYVGINEFKFSYSSLDGTGLRLIVRRQPMMPEHRAWNYEKTASDKVRLAFYHRRRHHQIPRMGRVRSSPSADAAPEAHQVRSSVASHATPRCSGKL